MKKVFIVSLLLLSTLFCKAQTVTIYRAGTATSPTYGTIKDAVAAALASDSLVLSEHTFTENGILIDKKLAFTGTSASGTGTVIDATNDSSAIILTNPTASGIVSLSIIDLEIINGESKSSLSTGGGAIQAGILTKLTISGTSYLHHNSTGAGGQFGGAIYSEGEVIISGKSSIDSNTASVSGGGIYINGTLHIRDSAAIYSNNANTGGGIFASSSDLYLSNTSVIADNHSTDYGGGMVLLNSNLSMKDSVVIGLNTTDTNYASGIYAKGNNDIIITGGQIIGNHSSDTDVNGMGMAIYNENASGGSSIVSIKNARIFNPDYTFKRQNEVYNLHTASAFISDTCWWGRSDTNGVIYSAPGSVMVMAGWVVADWSVNAGLPTASLSSFPVSAYFHMNTSDPLPPKMFWMLEGIFSCDSGSFSPAIAGMVAANTIASTYSIPWTNNLIKMLATVDIDTFKKSVYVAGLSIKEQAANTKLFFSVYPNPSQGILNIGRSEQSQGKVSLMLYNMLGQRVEQHELDFQNNKSTLSLKQGSGQYLVELRDEQGNVWREKIIIR